MSTTTLFAIPFPAPTATIPCAPTIAPIIPPTAPITAILFDNLIAI
ncbi:MAG: hypothetical protein HUJ68_10565 [Clostridia bacterium]|nr:hypothetical protein [Clostridia bacterium]